MDDRGMDWKRNKEASRSAEADMMRIVHCEATQSTSCES